MIRRRIFTREPLLRRVLGSKAGFLLAFFGGVFACFGVAELLCWMLDAGPIVGLPL